MKASVIVLTYNNTKYLEANLMSIKNQDYENIEVIVNDDCSPEVSLKDIEEQVYKTGIQEKYEVIINRLPENMGTVKNFNNAIKKSSGDIIIPLSCDDLFYGSDVVSKIVQYFEINNEYLFASGQLDRYSEDLKIKEATHPHPKYFQYFNDCPSDKTISIMIEQPIILGCVIVYTRSFFEKYGLFSERYHLVEDYGKAISVIKKGVKIGLMPFKTIIYRSGGVSKGKVHPSVPKDLLNCIQTEIVSDKHLWKQFSYITKRRVKRRIEMYTKYNEYKTYQKIAFRMKYIDLISIDRLHRLKK